MRRSFVTVLLGAALVAGCSSSDGPTSTCGDNTQSVNGECETVVTCGVGTVLVNNVCQPVASAGACGDGTVAVDGRCVPADGACDAGAHLVDGECVLDGDVVCGAGTSLNASGVCEPDSTTECGPGTVGETTSVGGVDVTVCELICTDGQIFDEVAEDCVDQCVAGTVYNASTHTCSAQCADDEYYVADLDDCVAVPECLRTSEDVDGNCVGWPFNELSLDTLCGRRAFNICQPMVDPACGCPHAGEYLGAGFTGAENGPLGNLPADLAGCVYGEMRFCEEHGVALLRALETEGTVAADADALTEFDDYFRLPQGTCEREAPFSYWPVESLADLVDGLVPDGEPCSHHLDCPDTDQCLIEELPGDAPLPNLRLGTCVARPTVGQVCDPRAPESATLNVPSVGPCAAGLRCVWNGEVYSCQAPKIQGQPCSFDNECTEPLVCRPNNIEDIMGGGDGDPAGLGDLSPPSCEPLLAAGDGCISSLGVVSWGQRDYCGAATYCDDSALGEDGDEIGSCVTAGGAGSACDWCSEYQDRPLISGSRVIIITDGGRIARATTIDSYTQSPFSVCGGDLVCTIDGFDDSASQTCAPTISVCQPTYEDISDLGGVCNPLICSEHCELPECSSDPACVG